MPLVKAKTIYERARIGGYAVGGFDAEHLDMVRAIVEAAEEVRSPVIVFLWEKEIETAGVGYLESLVKKAAEEASVPVAIHLDHGSTLKACLSAVLSGHTGVMIDYSHLPFEENVAKTKEVVDICHLVDVMVEAELGTVPRTFESDEPEYMEEKKLTDPDQAIDFIQRTGVDALTISIGEESGLSTSEVKLEFDILRAIRKQTDAYLIMHGGSGTPPDQITQVVHDGMIGIRFATELRIAFFDTMEEKRRELGRDFPDSRKILIPAREAVKSLVKERMKQMGSWGQACTDGLCPPIYKGVDLPKESLSHKSSSDVERIVEIIQRSLINRNQ
jgi:ketose-bisphosphate aldolase